jgi:hypothetical protein
MSKRDSARPSADCVKQRSGQYHALARRRAILTGQERNEIYKLIKKLPKDDCNSILLRNVQRRVP